MGDEASAARWTCADGRVLTELDLKIYARAGIEPAEAVLWAGAGIEPYAAGNFRSAGISLADASAGHQAGLSFTEVKELFAAELDLSHVAEWLSLTRDVGDITWAEANGLGPDEFRPIGQVFAALRASGVPNATCRQWYDEGQPLDERLAELETVIRSGVAVEDAPAELPWVTGFPDERERRSWQFACESSTVATELASRGLRPADALLGPDGAPMRHPQVTLIVDPSRPHLCRADGETLPERLAPFEDIEPSIEGLRGLGFEVIVGDRGARFANETTSGILLELADSTRRGDPRRVRTDEAGSAVLESPSSDGSGKQIAVSSSVSGALSYLAGFLEGTESRVVAVTSPDRDPETILSDLQPLAALHSGLQVRVQDSLHFESVAVGDGEWAFTVVDPDRPPVSFSINVHWFGDELSETESFAATEVEAAVAVALSREVFADSIKSNCDDFGLLLATVGPFAVLDPDDSIDLNGFSVVPARTSDGGWGYVPEDPESCEATDIASGDASWLPGGPVVFDQHEVIWRVGGFYWAKAWGDVTAETVIAGYFTVHEVALAAAAASSTYFQLTESGQLACELDDWPDDE